MPALTYLYDYGFIAILIEEITVEGKLAWCYYFFLPSYPLAFMLKISSFAKWGAAVLLLSSLTSCEDILEQYFPKPNPTPPTIPAQPVAYMAYSPQAGGNILRVFNPSTLATTREVPITGLSASDQLLSLDLRPATGQLYALTGTNVPATEPFTRPTITGGQLYTINPATGVATLVAPLSISLQGFSQFGFDFNPIADRIRIVSDQGQNLRVNPEDGTVIVDGVIRSPSDQCHCG